MTSISAQRGAVVVNGITTLFNNSGSVNATRVITNGVMVNNYNGGCASYIGADLLVCPSGGIGYRVGSAAWGPTTCAQQISNLSNQMYHDPKIVPGMYQTTQPLRQPISCNSSGSTCYYWYNVPYSGTSSGCGAGTPTAFGDYWVQLAAVYLSCPCGNYNLSSMVPQFWIGPSDSVKASPRGCSYSCGFCYQGKGGYGYIYGVCAAVYVGYSFTTVSE